MRAGTVHYFIIGLFAAFSSWASLTSVHLQKLLKDPFVSTQNVQRNATIRRQPKVPKYLPTHLRNESVLLVHVGKSSGSTMRQMARASNHYCRTMKSHNQTFNNLTRTHHCSVGRVTHNNEDVAHMWNQKFYPLHSQYLVTVRNPVDRLISWYNYEGNMFLRNQTRQFNLGQLVSRCYHDVDTAITHGLQNTTNQTKCQRLARNCFTGAIPCYAHNYYNYEVYTEDLLHWRTCAKALKQASNVTTAMNTVNATTNTVNATTNTTLEQACPPRDIRIDVLRTEHVQDDLKTLLELWTGVPIRHGFAHEPRNTASTLHIASSKYVSPQGIEQLCRSICPELRSYKSILREADNLGEEQIRDSHQELDERCGFSVDQVCGTKQEFRNIKKMRRIVRRG